MQNYNYSLEIKSLDKKGFFSGYASVFGVIDNHDDIILQGAFSETLENPEIKLLWQHRAEEPIGVFTHLEEDEEGLYVEGQLLLEVERAREAYALLKSGALKGLSIGFKVDDFEIDGETGVRVIKKAELFEISLVTFPANDSAKIISVKSDKEDELLSALNKALHTLVG